MIAKLSGAVDTVIESARRRRRPRPAACLPLPAPARRARRRACARARRRTSAGRPVRTSPAAPSQNFSGTSAGRSAGCGAGSARSATESTASGSLMGDPARCGSGLRGESAGSTAAALDQLEQVAHDRALPFDVAQLGIGGASGDRRRSENSSPQMAQEDAAVRRCRGRRRHCGRARRMAPGIAAGRRRTRPSRASSSGADMAGAPACQRARQRRQRRALAHQLVGHAQHRRQPARGLAAG